MEFFTGNLLNTTTMISVDSGTSTVKYMLDGNTDIFYLSSGYNNNTATIINFSFTSATVLTHILLQNHNFDEFYVYRDNTTSNCLWFECSNTSINTYISFASQTAQSIQIVPARTMTAAEKRIGQVALLEKRLDLVSLPSIKNYKNTMKRTEVIHKMPDGGKHRYSVNYNFEAKLNWRFITTAFKDNLKEFFDDSKPFYLVQKGTTTAWDGRAWEVNWLGNFDFKRSTNAEPVGWSGLVNLSQTSRVR